MLKWTYKILLIFIQIQQQFTWITHHCSHEYSLSLSRILFPFYIKSASHLFPEWGRKRLYERFVHAGLPLSGPGPTRPHIVVGGDPGVEYGHLEADLRLAPHVRAQEVEGDEGRDARLVSRYQCPLHNVSGGLPFCSWFQIDMIW